MNSRRFDAALPHPILNGHVLVFEIDIGFGGFTAYCAGCAQRLELPAHHSAGGVRLFFAARCETPLPLGDPK